MLLEWSINHRGESYVEKLNVELVLQRLHTIQKKLGAGTSLVKLFKDYLSWLSQPQQAKNNSILSALQNAYNSTTKKFNLVYQGVSVTLQEYAWLHAVSKSTMSRLSENTKQGVKNWSVSLRSHGRKGIRQTTPENSLAIAWLKKTKEELGEQIPNR